MKVTHIWEPGGNHWQQDMWEVFESIVHNNHLELTIYCNNTKHTKKLLHIVWDILYFLSWLQAEELAGNSWEIYHPVWFHHDV